MSFIDTHCHLDHKDYYNDIDEVIKQANINNVTHTIIPGADIVDLKRAQEIANSYNNIYFAVGVHPYDIDRFNLKELEYYINHPKCVAVGECGLDYFRLPSDEEEKKSIKAKQKEVFIAQIKLAQKYNKPLIVHIRDANSDAKEILLQENAKNGVLHCFNASAMLLELSKNNFYFGIGGIATFKNAKKLIEILPQIPLDKLVLETDGPYLTPHPHRGQRNEPKYIPLIAQKVAQILDLDIDEVKNITTANANRLFNL
jgi:TatD DNase family protein